MENRRRYQRLSFECKIIAIIYAEHLNFSATVIDISEGGIGIISEKPIEVGKKISISLFPLFEDLIPGRAVYSSYIEHDQKYYYRIGIETEYLALERMRIYGPLKTSEFNTEIISQNNKTDSKIKKA